ncbi:MAG: aminotransferase class I/II-fold pyridoxal phosphate-dependent enzyme [Maribacter sp.]|nr:aminotransferase class I/II-fold pyridoxal phosphate-dependent enzyme [Maribacter sp.]
MKNPLLTAAYSPEDFRKRGHLLIDVLADHLKEKLSGGAEKTIDWKLPEAEYALWTEFLINGNESSLFSNILERTTHVHNPKCIGHQITPTAPITALTGMIGSLLNNGMAVYEMGMAPSAIERVVTEMLCKKLGYTDTSRGFLTSGGTLANLTALLSARKAKASENIWKEGSGKPLGIMVSEEAHYCIDRAARIMGFGEKGIIKIPVKADFSIDTSELEARFNTASTNGIEIFAIIGSAPCTATGSYDDLQALGKFAKKHNLWFHVDGAHGGAAIFSKKYRHTVSGISLADSVVIDGHKMMMLPAITTALLFKNGNQSYATFSQKADYLLGQSEDEDWYNLAKRTFECTKTMMSIHWYTILKIYGEGIFDEYVSQLYDMGKTFGAIIQQNPHFELATKPQCNIVCFRYVDMAMSLDTLNSLNANIRQKLLEAGEFYIVQTQIKGIHYLRTTIMNPFTTGDHLQLLLEKIQQKAKEIIKNMMTV